MSDPYIMGLRVSRWRQHADTLRSIAAGYRARSTEGPQHWRELEIREAERLEAEAERALKWALEGERMEAEDDAA